MIQRDHGREERGIKALGKREREREFSRLDRFFFSFQKKLMKKKKSIGARARKKKNATHHRLLHFSIWMFSKSSAFCFYSRDVKTTTTTTTALSVYLHFFWWWGTPPLCARVRRRDSLALLSHGEHARRDSYFSMMLSTKTTKKPTRRSSRSMSRGRRR